MKKYVLTQEDIENNKKTGIYRFNTGFIPEKGDEFYFKCPSCGKFHNITDKLFYYRCNRLVCDCCYTDFIDTNKIFEACDVYLVYTNAKACNNINLIFGTLINTMNYKVQEDLIYTTGYCDFQAIDYSFFIDQLKSYCLLKKSSNIIFMMYINDNLKLAQYLSPEDMKFIYNNDFIIFDDKLNKYDSKDHKNPDIFKPIEDERASLIPILDTNQFSIKKQHKNYICSYYDDEVFKIEQYVSLDDFFRKLKICNTDTLIRANELLELVNNTDLVNTDTSMYKIFFYDRLLAMVKEKASKINNLNEDISNLKIYSVYISLDNKECYFSTSCDLDDDDDDEYRFIISFDEMNKVFELDKLIDIIYSFDPDRHIDEICANLYDITNDSVLLNQSVFSIEIDNYTDYFIQAVFDKELWNGDFNAFIK